MTADTDDLRVKLERGLARFRHSAARADRRRRIALALGAAFKVAPLALAFVALPLAWVKLAPRHGAEAWVWVAVGLGLALVLGRALAAAWKKSAPLAGAIE